MDILSNLSSKLVRFLLRDPSATASGLVFILGFSLIAINALYGQQRQHPSPIYETSKNETPQTIQRVAVTPANLPVTRTVLTQRISIANIPVPTANPARLNQLNSVAAQSSLVRDVQGALAKIGMYKGKVDGIYGTVTRQAIINYQKRAGILPDGEASFGLLTALKSAQVVLGDQAPTEESQSSQTPRTLRQPKLLVFDAETVTKIQAGLKNNFAEEQISVDGIIGQQTRSAIRRFQERFKLNANGQLNEETIEKMVSVGVINQI